MATMLARIHPRDAGRGYLARNVLLSGSGYPKFEVTRGWYQVDKGIVPRLRKLLNNPNDPRSAPIFQVCTKSEAIAIEEAEKEEIAIASAPIPVPKSRQSQIGSASQPATVAKATAVLEPVPKRPKVIETADPEDPEDADFVVLEDDEWPEDMGDEEDDEEDDEAPPDPEPKLKKKVAKKTKAKKKPTKRAKKK